MGNFPADRTPNPKHLRARRLVPRFLSFSPLQKLRANLYGFADQKIVSCACNTEEGPKEGEEEGGELRNGHESRIS